MTADAATALKTFAQQFAGMHVAVVIIATVAGLYFTAMAIYNWATLPSKQRQGGSASLPAFQTVVGAVLLSISSIVQIQTRTFIADVEPRTALDYMSATESTGEEGKLLALVLLGLMTVFGWAAIVRGWIILAKIGHLQSGDKGSQFWNACVFLICGTIASNMLAFGDLVAWSFGSPNYLRMYLGS